MNGSLSMLVPLQTLDGWPAVEDPSMLSVLALLVGAPLLVIALVAVWARIHHAVRGNMGVPAVANQPIWVNGRRIEPATQGGESRDAIEAGHEAVTSGMDKRQQEAATVTEARPDGDVGGAGARW